MENQRNRFKLNRNEDEEMGELELDRDLLRELLSKCETEEERRKLCLEIAREYAKQKDFESARRYLQANYLGSNPSYSEEEQKYMADIEERKNEAETPNDFDEEAQNEAEGDEYRQFGCSCTGSRGNGNGSSRVSSGRRFGHLESNCAPEPKRPSDDDDDDGSDGTAKKKETQLESSILETLNDLNARIRRMEASQGRSQANLTDASTSTSSPDRNSIPTTTESESSDENLGTSSDKGEGRSEETSSSTPFAYATPDELDHSVMFRMTSWRIRTVVVDPGENDTTGLGSMSASNNGQGSMGTRETRSSNPNRNPVPVSRDQRRDPHGEGGVIYKPLRRCSPPGYPLRSEPRNHSISNERDNTENNKTAYQSEDEFKSGRATSGPGPESKDAPPKKNKEDEEYEPEPECDCCGLCCLFSWCC